jgi:GTP cyclohydrolase I
MMAFSDHDLSSLPPDRRRPGIRRFALSTPPRRNGPAGHAADKTDTRPVPCCDIDSGHEAAGVDYDRIRRAVREILFAVGENPDREGLLETPDRVARMYAEIFSGLRTDPAEHLKKTFTQKHDEMVLVKDIEFASCCEHHLLPFTGKAHIAYLPDGKVVGLSKLARVVDAVARRPQVQERMTEDLADLVTADLNPRGVGVILEASHSCMTIRGVRKPGSMTITSALRGIFKSNPTTRAELMSLVFGGR